MARFGLDFGTTNSSFSLPEEGEVRILDLDIKTQDPRVVRSMLYFFHRDLVEIKDASGKVTSVYRGDFKHTFGQDAVEHYLNDNKNRKPGKIREIYTGRYIRSTYSVDAGLPDLVAEYYEDIDYGTGRLLQALKTGLKSPTYKGTNIFGKFFTLEQLIGFYVSHLKKLAEGQGYSSSQLKCGRPVYFSENPKVDNLAQQRLKDGLEMAGFNEIVFEYEPVAAAKYFLFKNKLQKKKIFVFDFGGGTLDTTIMEWDNGYKVLATDGIYIGGNLLNADIFQNKLGTYFGADSVWGEFQTPLPRHIIDSLNSWYAIPNLNNPSDMKILNSSRYKNSDPEAFEKLIYLVKANLGFEIYEAIEQAKQQLSSQSVTKISYSNGPININLSITVAEFEEIIKPRIESVKQVVLRTLKKAKCEPAEIEIVVRTGGSSLIPMVERMLADIFGRDKVQLFDTFTSIAAGLAIE